VWQVLQRGVERGELDADIDFAFVYDLLVGPLFMRAVVWGQPLAADAAEQTADVILAAFGTTPRRSPT
jgi:Tetracyclin repressor-like, C-terminal domain